MKELLIMRNEVLEGGSPLPLRKLLDERTDLSIQNPAIKKVWSNTICSMMQLVIDTVPKVKPVAPELWRLDDKKAQFAESSGGFAVTLDSYDTTGAYPLMVSRHFAPGGSEQIGVGERPGSEPLPAQIRKIKDAAVEQPVIVFEDDMFTGGTARFVIEQMLEANLNIVAFVPGLQASSIAEIGGVTIEPIERYAAGVRDIVDPRDLIFGLPDGGLTIKQDGELHRAPYCLPYVDVANRASIPGRHAKNFSLGVAEMNAEFYGQLQSLIGNKIYVADLASEFGDFVLANLPKGTLDMSIDDFCEYTRTELE